MKKYLFILSLLSLLSCTTPQMYNYTIEVTYQDGTTQIFYNIIAPWGPDIESRSDACLEASWWGTIACGVRTWKIISKTQQK